MTETRLGIVGSTKVVKFPVGNKLCEKTVIVTIDGFETVPGSQHEIGNIPENLQDNSLAGARGRCYYAAM
jgi:hypothetical protein